MDTFFFVLAVNFEKAVQFELIALAKANSLFTISRSFLQLLFCNWVCVCVSQTGRSGKWSRPWLLTQLLFLFPPLPSPSRGRLFTLPTAVLTSISQFPADRSIVDCLQACVSATSKQYRLSSFDDLRPPGPGNFRNFCLGDRKRDSVTISLCRPFHSQGHFTEHHHPSYTTQTSVIEPNRGCVTPAYLRIFQSQPRGIVGVCRALWMTLTSWIAFGS